MKYATCGPITATGWPDSDSAADTSSAFDIELIEPRPPSRPPSGSSRPAPLFGGSTSDPASGIATPELPRSRG